MQHVRTPARTNSFAVTISRLLRGLLQGIVVFSTPAHAGPDILHYFSTLVRPGATGSAISRLPRILLQWIVVFLDSRAQCAGHTVVLLDSCAPLARHTTAAVDCCTHRSNINLCARLRCKAMQLTITIAYSLICALKRACKCNRLWKYIQFEKYLNFA